MKIEPKHLYMALPVALLTMSVSIQMTAAVLASRGNGAEIERDYYERAVNWDQYQKEVAASGELGWTVEIRTDELRAPGAPVEVVLVLLDSDGVAIEGASGHVEAFQNAHVDEMHSLDLEELGPGYYHATMRPLRSGHWVWRLRFERGDELFVGEYRSELYGAAESGK